MKKDYLLYLKNALPIGCMMGSLYLLTGCGSNTDVDDREVTDTQKEEIDYHQHLMINIGDTTYIFRECDENIRDLRVTIDRRYIHYKVYDENNELIINAYAYGDIDDNIIDSEKQEMVVREFEEAAIESGAVLYQDLGK